MEPLFESRFYCNHRMMAEFYRKIGTGPRYPVVALGAAVACGLALYSRIMASWRKRHVRCCT